jgi:hypothetical protein
MQHRCLPTTTTIHIYLRSENPPFHYIRPLEVLVVRLTAIMQSHGVGRMRAQVNALCA